MPEFPDYTCEYVRFKSEHPLALSGEGDPEQRVLIERILSRRPEPSDEWEYYSAKQRSQGEVAWLDTRSRSGVFDCSSYPGMVIGDLADEIV